ncbi:MAG: metallophosphoesterase family protein [Catenisphaera adipataccumulans]|jgi:hypothetical protein|uniref:metallophosphoesterase family protein n=1 Tax=Catenisphaera adipataccumulans TaxID=700500 RepID=UPI003D912D3D
MIYITGDTHREIDIAKINPDDRFAAGKTMTDQDYLIICGDFGCIWDGGSGDSFWLDWLESLPWTTCFVDGNHENFELLEQFPTADWHGGRVHRIRSNIVHLQRGEVFDIDGRRFFTFGGAFSHDLMFRIEHISWWRGEMATKADVENAFANLDQVGWKVDGVITHDVYLRDPMSRSHSVSMAPYGAGYCDIRQVLDCIEKRLDYKYWFHGHYHRDCVYLKGKRPSICLYDQVIRYDDVDRWIERLPEEE